MPMIDVYAAAGTFVDKNKLAQDLANAVMKWEGVPSTDLFKQNTAAFVHELPSDAISNAAGDNNYVRVQVLTPVNVLNREKQVGVVRELTDIVAAAAGDRTLASRTWVLIAESPDGGWGINGQRSRMQTLSPPPVRSWEIRKERRVLEKDPSLLICREEMV
jgi:phenylpyruvate tautomerase PptA (4-oxalocrotonate tautomerase family)